MKNRRNRRRRRAMPTWKWNTHSSYCGRLRFRGWRLESGRALLRTLDARCIESIMAKSLNNQFKN
jgi:hypothetical protein